MRLIDADARRKEHCEDCSADIQEFCKDDPVCASLIWLNEASTIDAVPVVHGVWERSIDNDCPMHKCSVCGARVVKGLYEYENPNLYCYHCGAKMDGERRSDD